MIYSCMLDHHVLRNGAWKSVLMLVQRFCNPQVFCSMPLRLGSLWTDLGQWWVHLVLYLFYEQWPKVKRTKRRPFTEELCLEPIFLLEIPFFPQQTASLKEMKTRAETHSQQPAANAFGGDTVNCRDKRYLCLWLLPICLAWQIFLIRVSRGRL